MIETHYAYAVSYMKTFENKMLTSNEIETLINVQETGQALKLLADKGYGNTDYKDVETILKTELEKVWREVKNACPENAPLEILLYKNDFHNLKTILKAYVSGAEYKGLLLNPCVTEPEEIEKAVKEAYFDNLPDFIKGYAETSYSIVTSTLDGQSMETYLDRACLEAMRKRAEKEDEFLRDWVELNITIANMKTAARAVGRTADFIREAMVENKDSERLVFASLKSKNEVVETISSMGYPKGAELLSQSFSDFEKWCDNLKMDYIKKAKTKSFGFEPILAFLVGKESELQTLRIILSAKENGIEPEIIRERLRDLYV